MGIDLLLRTVLRFLTFHWLQDRFSKCKLIRMVDFEGLNRLLGQMCKSCVYRQDQFYQNQDQEPKMFAIENVRLKLIQLNLFANLNNSMIFLFA